jgi:hypothetical protein
MDSVGTDPGFTTDKTLKLEKEMNKYKLVEFERPRAMTK